MNHERINFIRNIALLAFVILLFVWVSIRAPFHIYNFYMWVDIGLMISGTVLLVLWLITRSEK